MMDTDNKQVQSAEYLELAQRYVAGDQSVAPQLRALVDQQAKQWMGDKAQIVDAAGEPRVVYHGTPNEFNAFSHDYMGTQGTADGQGFYFTDDAEFARMYQQSGGRSMATYLKIENVLDSEQWTLSKADVQAIIQAIDPEGDGFLSNYGDVGYEGYNAVLREAVASELDSSANDVDFIGNLVNSGEEMAAVYHVLTQVKGDSGIVAPQQDGSTHYIVGNPNQIKSAELVTFDDAGHIIPLSQRFDPRQNDIRYSHASDGQKPQPPNPAGAICAQLEQVLGDKAVLVNVVDAAQQPPHQAMKLISGSVEGWFDGRSGQISLVAATVTPERAAWVAWHELGHRGVALAHFDDYRAVMQDADQNSTVRVLADAVQQERRQYRFDPAADTREVAVEEALVELYAAQKTGNYTALETRYGIKVPAAVKPGIAGTLQRVAEKLGTVLNKVFGRQPHNTFSHAEVFGLLHVIDRHSGKNAGSPNTGVRYSQAPPAPSSSSSTTTEPDHAAQRLARAKDNYHSQSYLLTNAERQHRAVLEYGMEKLTATMPPALKAEAQANFYENQVRQTANLMDVPTSFRQPEASVTLSSVSPMTSAQVSAAVSMGNQSEQEFDR